MQRGMRAIERSVKRSNERVEGRVEVVMGSCTERE